MFNISSRSKAAAHDFIEAATIIGGLAVFGAIGWYSPTLLAAWLVLGVLAGIWKYQNFRAYGRWDE